jgi:putative sigma-54 modulation protein
MTVNLKKIPTVSQSQDFTTPAPLQDQDGFPILVLNRAKAFTLNRMTGSLERRIRKALARFSPAIKKVRLVLEDENGPRGGNDKRALVQVSLENGGYLAASGQGTLFARALAFSLERVNVHLRKINGRRTSSRRRKGKLEWNSQLGFE